MAKMALIERELKRDKLVAKYAKKHAELKAISTDAKRTDEERAAARLGLQALPRNATQPGSVTAVPLLVAPAVRSSNLAWRVQRFAKWLLPVKYLALSRPAGNR